MTALQIGNPHGVTAVQPAGTILCEITADGANTVTVSADDVLKLSIGMEIDIIQKSNGAVLASDRLITGITSAGVVTYSGADVAAVAGTHAIYINYAANHKTNQNGGSSATMPYQHNSIGNLKRMRDRLKAIDATLYSDANLNKMTFNDMVYAIRVKDDLASIK